MFKNIRTLSLAAAITLACAPVAIAFPPCPLDETELFPLHQPPIGISATSWTSSSYSHAGSISPIRVREQCQHNFPEVLGRVPDSGPCDEDVLMLDDLPRAASAGSLDQPLGYAKYGWVGHLGLPELRLQESVDKHYEYTFTLAVNTTRLAHVGDWIDISEMTLVGRDESTPTTTYRLRKVAARDGSTELRLIASRRLREPGAPERSIVAVVPLNKNDGFQVVAMRWTASSRKRNPPPLGTKPASLPTSEYIVDTQLVVTAGNKVIHEAALQDQMPNDVSMGVLAYNLPLASSPDNETGIDNPVQTAGSHDVSDMKADADASSALAPPIPGMYEPGRALVFPRATLRSRKI